MEEVSHIIEILKIAKESLKTKDSTKLNEISNQTVHSASTFQESGSITLAVLIYALSKLIERGDNRKIKNWDKSINKINSFFDLSILALKEGKNERYEYYLQKIRAVLTSMSVNLRPYIQEVIRKSSINKASRIYEHGISLGQTAKLLGITYWELSEYTGQKANHDESYNITLETKKRAKMALDFLS